MIKLKIKSNVRKTSKVIHKVKGSPMAVMSELALGVNYILDDIEELGGMPKRKLIASLYSTLNDFDKRN